MVLEVSSWRKPPVTCQNREEPVLNGISSPCLRNSLPKKANSAFLWDLCQYPCGYIRNLSQLLLSNARYITDLNKTAETGGLYGIGWLVRGGYSNSRVFVQIILMWLLFLHFSCTNLYWFPLHSLICRFKSVILYYTSPRYSKESQTFRLLCELLCLGRNLPDTNVIYYL